MAKKTVKASCGHTYEAELKGPQRDRERKQSWIEELGLCPLCYREECVNQERELQSLLETSLKLPTLLGSENQVAWARSIRARKIDELLRENEESLNIESLWSAIKETRPGTAVLYNQRASFWIENRARGLMSIMRRRAKGERASISFLR